MKARLSNVEVCKFIQKKKKILYFIKKKKETLKYQKYLEEIENVGILKTSGLKPNIDNSRLVGSLKKQLKELKENLRMKDEELNKYKKSIKFTKIREIQVKISFSY